MQLFQSTRSTRPCRSRRAGFSLIDMVVVVGLMGMLLGLLMPVLGGAREKARTVVCASNQRQIGIGFEAAINERPDHRYPEWAFPDSPAAMGKTDPEQSWVYMTASYVSDEMPRIAACPSDASPFRDKKTPGMPGRFREVSYGVNPFISRPEANPIFRGLDASGARFSNVHNLRSPSSLVGMGELPERLPGAAVADKVRFDQVELNADNSVCIPPDLAMDMDNHEEELSNYLFLDGHVETRSFADLLRSARLFPAGVGTLAVND